MQSRPPQVLAIVASSTCVVAVLALVAGYLEFGPHARHMMAHILTMNVAAPALGAILLARYTKPVRGVSLLWSATFVQIAVLWTWHTPTVQTLTLHAPGGTVVMHIVLLVVAMAFWASLFSLPAPSRWQAIPALLFTGKLVCLLAALLVFAPRSLYGSHAAHSLDDQHLAGLLMLAACPLSYLVAAVLMTVHMIGAGEPSREMPPIQRTAA
jgi:putative membrane protein